MNKLQNTDIRRKDNESKQNKKCNTEVKDVRLKSKMLTILR